MSNILVISGHPNLGQSTANRLILERLQEKMPDVSVRHLAELYPDSKINTAAEQKALLQADIIVLQFPFYWYSVPGIMKQWLDDVFTYGFAYGSTGDKLKGKQLLLSTTIGAAEEAYQPGGFNEFTTDELLLPLRRTANLSQLVWQKPLTGHGMVFIPGVYNSQEAVEERAEKHAQNLLDRLNELTRANDQRIIDFVTDWFSRIDKLPSDPATFLNHLSDDVLIDVPEGKFRGHAGFRDWYQQLVVQFKSNCQHRVHTMSVESAREGRFDVHFLVELTAETVQGEPVTLNASERWTVAMNQDRPQIDFYQVSRE